MSIEFEGKTIDTVGEGYLANAEDWSEDLARFMARNEGIPELTARHWDVLNYLRDEFLNNSQHQPNNREMMKEMSERWGVKVEQKMLFDLFPGTPSKQAGRIAGLPESRRKGGY